MGATENRTDMGKVPEPRLRMVPAGTHFAATPSSAASDEMAKRPADARFAAKSGEGEDVPRPAGKRFAAPAASAADVGPTARPAGKRFATPEAPAPEPEADAAVTTSLPGDSFADLSEESARVAALESLDAPVPGTAASATPQTDATTPPAEEADVTRVQPAPAPAPAPRAQAAPAAAPHVQPAAPVRPVPAAPATAPRGPVEGGQHEGAEVKRRKKPVLAIVLIVLGAILLLVAGGLYIATQMRYREAQETYTEMQSYTVESDEGDGVPSVDFEALAQINPDIVGWIYIPGTPINYPVVQTTDNTTYLDRLFDGTPNESGTIFMDMANTPPGMYDQQTTLYGHHTYDGSMFQTVDDTTDQAAFDRIEVAYYITRTATYVMTPLLTAQVDETYVAARQPNFLGEGESLAGYLEDMLAQAKAVAPDAEERIATADSVMSLVTCAGEIVPRTTRAVMVLTVDRMIGHGL